MPCVNRVSSVLVAILLILCSTTDVLAQGGPRGPGFGRGKGRGPDAQFAEDRDVFHFLLAHHKQIQREVTNIEDGVVTVTRSKDPDVAAKIQEHVTAMYDRVENARPIRMRDPLFAEIFRHADKVKMKVDKVDGGVKVTESSADPYVAKLIQEHARVVSLFVKRGFDEAHRSHAVPRK